jgi:hypothetical protein
MTAGSVFQSLPALVMETPAEAVLARGLFASKPMSMGPVLQQGGN